MLSGILTSQKFIQLLGSGTDLDKLGPLLILTSQKFIQLLGSGADLDKLGPLLITLGRRGKSQISRIQFLSFRHNLSEGGENNNIPVPEIMCTDIFQLQNEVSKIEPPPWP